MSSSSPGCSAGCSPDGTDHQLKISAIRGDFYLLTT
jgi:hypothetical protein